LRLVNSLANSTQLTRTCCFMTAAKSRICWLAICYCSPAVSDCKKMTKSHVSQNSISQRTQRVCPSVLWVIVWFQKPIISWI